MQIGWTEGPRLPVGLGGHVAAVVDDRLLVMGGTNWVDEKKYWRDQVWALDGKNRSWREWGKLPVGLALSAPVVTDDSLLLLGGWTERGSTARTFRCANGAVTPSTLKNLPSDRALAGGGAAGEAIYVIGGLADPVEFKTAMASVIRLIPNDEKGGWAEVAPLPKRLGLATTVSSGGKIFVFGGMGPSGDSTADSADAFCYDPVLDRWTKLSPLPGARRGAAGLAIDDRYILMVGGCRGEKDGPVMLDEVLTYDIRADRYRVCTPLPYAALCEQAVMKDGRIYVLGGEDRPRHRTDRVVVGKLVSGE
jgi:N-acetylneuraminic acid mutarotase